MMKKIYAIAVFNLFISLVNAQVTDEAKRLLDSGKNILMSGNEKEALKTFDQAIRVSKAKPYREGSPEVYMLIGDIYLNAASRNKCYICTAYNYYTRSRDIDPNRKIIWDKMNDERFKPMKTQVDFCTYCNSH
ncbi:MAG: hypothetical protein JNL70_16365 [Saprospiraceae bacterium]|nr:hypothetical protein [Saprospiraceae bacterium]